ncbi:DMT family transporter [Pseudomonas sp. MMS21-TM103]|uniref:DMT family transporter n=1 Tax=Pseudomonas sp. MMS21 TM103 TaxID=2886506 RepID=UPI001EDDA3DE|nr:DMT family transporter [Pseudomonas sp. MMS21 TM103]MCG4454064.1 DMT family transporter [Pseudomonas sp. MMS21 TM103]
MHSASPLVLHDGYARGFMLVLLSAFCYGLQPLFAQYAYAGGADPVGLLLVRFVFAASILLLFLRLRGMRLPRGRLAGQNLLVGVGYGFAALGYYSASRSTSVSLAVILMFSFPAFVTALSIAYLGERTSPLKLLSLVLALGGVLLATGLSFQGEMSGVLWALFSALSYGSAIVYGTHSIRHEQPLASAAMVLLGCALTFALAALFFGATPPSGAPAWWATLGLALFATILPVAAFLAGSPHIGSSSASTLSTLEPVVAVTIAVLLIGEHISAGMLGGGLMVVAAAIILSRQGGTLPEPSLIPLPVPEEPDDRL